MRRVLAGVVVVGALAASLMLPALPWWGLVGMFSVAGVAAWRFGTCSHRGPLGLLPATTDIDGRPVPARWYCDACGKTWAAHFEHEHRPVPRFSGYDESKAVHAARRAAELADRQRALALQRAGLPPAAKKARTTRATPAPAPESADVVPIGHGRRLAG